MPIYEYRCESCGKVHEILQKFSDEPLKECPDCKGCLSKLISNTSFVLKGSGWYADGYSSTSKKSSASCAAPDSAPKAEPAKPDSPKPAAKKEAAA